jgi:hypothetical protein
MVGVVREVGFGNRDVGRPVLWFTVHLSNGLACLQVFRGEEIGQVVEDSGVYDIKSLNGKTCWMRSTGPNTTRFDEWWDPK